MLNYKILLTYILLTCFSLSATIEQVEQYLSISSIENELLRLESKYSTIQNTFKKDTNSSESNYDTQILSIRFKNFIQKHLSENEMSKILNLYKNLILLQFTSALNESSTHNKNDIESYFKLQKKELGFSQRMKLIEKITKILHTEKSQILLFDALTKPLMKKGIGGYKKMSDKVIKESQKGYLALIQETTKKEIFYACKDFSLKELDDLIKIIKLPASELEIKTRFSALAYTLKEFNLLFAQQYDNYITNSTTITKKVQ